MKKMFASLGFCLGLCLLTSLNFQANSQCIRQFEVPTPRVNDAGVYNFYDENAPKVISEIPKGFKVVGISHYGRHGQRYYCNENASFLEMLQVLEEANAQGNLTERGKMVYEAYKAYYPYMMDRDGELTQLGRQQHYGIAKRMYAEYKHLFTPDATLTAWSTLVPRCIESMGAFCEEMGRQNSKIRILAEASNRYLIQVSPMQEYVYHYKIDYKPAVKKIRNDYFRSVLDSVALAKNIFKQVEKEQAGKLALVTRSVYSVYLSLPGTDFYHLDAAKAYRYAVDGKAYADKPEMAPLFDDETWQLLINMEEYCHQSEAIPQVLYNGTIGIYMAEAILNLVDEDLASGKKFVRLRFGHDNILQTFFAHCGIEGWRIHEKLEDTMAEWNLSRFPMASNMQCIFYRKKGDDRVLFRMLLNDSELQLPIEPVCGRIYDWKTFRNYMQPRIEEGKVIAAPYIKYPYPLR